jgi:mannose-6-phosphate isomerase-like protein (cupin superfamily)
MAAIYVPAGTERSGTELRMWGLAPLHTKVSGADTGGRLFVCEIIGAGFGPPRHLHYEQDEWFYVTQGTFRVEIGGEVFDAKAGDSLFAPRNIPHAWAPTGDGTGTMVFALQPAGPFESFVRAGAALGHLPTRQEADALFEAHGMKITGPPLDVAKTSF